MINTLSFLNQDWFVQIISVTVALWLLFVWKEWRSDQPKSKFIVNCCIAFLGLSAIALIALKPASLKERGHSKLVVLTSGYQQTQLDSLKKLYKRIKVTTYQDNQPMFTKAQMPTEVFVLGHGIDGFNFWQLEGVKSHFLNGTSITGITQLKYDLEMLMGQHLSVNGAYKSPKLGHSINLESPGGATLDSLVIADSLDMTFKLSSTLNAIGKFRYTISEKDSLGTVISRDPLPVVVKTQQALRVLILNGFPTFETKYLKNFLAEMGHELVVRSQVTKGKFKYEYFNVDQQAKPRLTKENLTSFDLVIFDSKSLNNLSTSQSTAVEKAIKEDGLGVFIQPDKSYFTNRKRLVNFEFLGQNSSQVTFDNWPKTKVSTYPYQFKNTGFINSIHEKDSTLFSVYKNLGAGRVGAMVLQNTYNLVLSGKTEVYKTLWTGIIDGISKKAKPIAEWHSNTHLAIKDQPFAFTLRTNIPNPTVTESNGLSIPLKQDIDVNSLWSGTSYPKRSGWHELKVAQDSTHLHHFFVTDSTYFRALSASKKLNSNQKHFSSDQSKSIVTTQPNPINPLWFFVVFILSFGYLWLVPKL